MKKVLIFLLIFLSSNSSKGQDLLIEIDSILENDSINYVDLQMGLDYFAKRNLGESRYEVFNCNIKKDDGKKTSKLFFIYDKEIKKIHRLELRKQFRLRVIHHRFLKFYENKLLIGYVDTNSDNCLDEFSLTGKRISEQKGPFFLNNKSKFYDPESNISIWTDYDRKMYVLYLENGQKKLLGKVYLEKSHDGGYYGAPEVKIDSTNKQIIITNFIRKLGSTKIKYFHPENEHNVIDDKIIFSY